MRPTLFTRASIGVLMIVAFVGAVDAAAGDEWDLTVIFTVVILGLGVLLARTSVARPLVPIRGDLVRWLSARAAVHGERVEVVADRAVAAYRDGLTACHADDRGRGTS